MKAGKPTASSAAVPSPIRVSDFASSRKIATDHLLELIAKPPVTNTGSKKKCIQLNPTLEPISSACSALLPDRVISA
jgi:hypothetical protein